MLFKSVHLTRESVSVRLIAFLFFSCAFLYLCSIVSKYLPHFSTFRYFLYIFCSINTCSYRLKKVWKAPARSGRENALSAIFLKQVLNLKKMTPWNAVFVFWTVKNAFPKNIGSYILYFFMLCLYTNSVVLHGVDTYYAIRRNIEIIAIY